MKQLLMIALLALMACGPVTGPERTDGARCITYEFSGNARIIQYAEWRVRPGICENQCNVELPFTVESETSVSQLCVYVCKYSKDRSVTVDIYEGGELIGTCTAGEGDYDAIWIEK